MQTFLPYADFAASAKVLDRQRLGKQRVECKQIINALEGTSKGWQNHPATLMWKDHPVALALYGAIVCQEWISRGYKDTLLPFFQERMQHRPLTEPYWWGDDKFHASHRSNLLRKMPEHYRKFWPDEPDDLPYVWPT